MSRRWWEQEGIDLEKAKGRAAETKKTDLELESDVESEEGWGRVKRIKWRGAERSGVNTPGGRRARPEER